MYLANSGYRLGKESFYDPINLSDSTLKLMSTNVENKAWEIANALNLDH